MVGTIRTSLIIASAAAALVMGCSQQPPPRGPGDGHGPPQEAIDACKGQADGAACTAKMGDKTVEGTCKKGPDNQGELACMPQGGGPGGPPPGGPGGPPPGGPGGPAAGQ